MFLFLITLSYYILFGCLCDTVSMETKAGASGELSNELSLFRGVIFDWL